MDPISAISASTNIFTKIIEISQQIAGHGSQSNKNEKDHLQRLSKFHLEYTIASVREIKGIMEKLIELKDEYKMTNHITKCLNNIYFKLRLIDSRFNSLVYLSGDATSDSLILYERFLDLLFNLCSKLENLLNLESTDPFVIINKIKENFNELRPTIKNNDIISMKSDRNEKYLGYTGLCPLYHMLGITKLTTKNFGGNAKFSIIKAESFSNDKDIKTLKYSDEIRLQHGSYGFLTYYISGIKEQTHWWYFTYETSIKNTFIIINPCNNELKRELRIGDRVCLQLKIAIEGNRDYKYLSGRVSSKCLKLSRKPYNWTIYNRDGILNDIVVDQI